MKKLMIPCITLKGDEVNNGNITEGPLLAAMYRDRGADALLVNDISEGDEEHEKMILCLREICECAEIPVYAAGNVKRLEDVKKFLYAGCSDVIVDFEGDGNAELLTEASKRFGKDKIIAAVRNADEYVGGKELIDDLAHAIFLKDASGDSFKRICDVTGLPVILGYAGDEFDDAADMLRNDNAAGISGGLFADVSADIISLKSRLKESGVDVVWDESSIAWPEFKLNSDGLIPVIVQDYKTDEVLMLAYMNEEAFDATIRTGRMTYFSRSRQELWVKGLTSGHFQYVKELRLDCDNDTILAKVDQVGAACHTGSRSCFFQTLLKKEYDDTNPLRVFQSVYDVILDRKVHPKEGSYTNYLFDKGIDKILKKVGEECTEIVIAAKNPDKEEIKYEISDFLYHVMVLMAEKGVTWEEITRELARR